jgi:hypothetical protein
MCFVAFISIDRAAICFVFMSFNPQPPRAFNSKVKNLAADFLQAHAMLLSHVQATQQVS